MSKTTRPTFMIFASWRLIAALLVMLYHFCLHGPAEYLEFSKTLELLTPMLDMFFIISGFLISVHYADRLHSISDFKSFLLRRLARLYPLHILTLSCFCLIWVGTSSGFFSSTMTETYTFAELLKHLLLINAWGVSETLTFNYVSWSLSAEWFCYLLLPVILITWRKWGLGGLIALFVGSLIGLEMLTAFGIMPFPSWLVADTWGAYRVFADFVLGAIIAHLASKNMFTIRNHIWAWLGFVATLVVMLADLWGYWAIIAFAIALFIAAQVEINDPARSNYLKPLMPLASVSFGIYLWHPIVASVMIGAIWKRVLLPMNAMSFMTIMIISMVLSVIVAVVSAYLFEAPMRKKILSWGEKRTNPLVDDKKATAGVPAE